MENLLENLTPRERELVGYFREGYSNRAAAVRLGISVKTVQTHRAKINQVLGVHSPTQLLALLLRSEEDRASELKSGGALQRLLNHFRVRALVTEPSRPAWNDLRSPWREAAASAGSVGALADELGVRRMALWRWANGERSPRTVARDSVNAWFRRRGLAEPFA